MAPSSAPATPPHRPHHPRLTTLLELQDYPPAPGADHHAGAIHNRRAFPPSWSWLCRPSCAAAPVAAEGRCVTGFAATASWIPYYVHGELVRRAAVCCV
ncbi:hypothetical protein DL770_002215 [Monosporascus sp. CRB-9-2]|nr:hypothetical protein DL770_002215 [Monosporascus sp. CRB-9-2]